MTCKPCEALREVTCEILTDDEEKRKICREIIHSMFMGEITEADAAKALGVSVNNVLKAVEEAVRKVKQMFKLECRIPEEVFDAMRKAMNLSLKIGREVGFSSCDGKVDEFYVGTDGMVVYPPCAGSERISFHTHPNGTGPSIMDVISALANDTKLECVGSGDKIICVDLSNVPAWLKEKARKEYVEWIKSLPKIDENTVRANIKKLTEKLRQTLDEVAKYAKMCYFEP